MELADHGSKTVFRGGVKLARGNSILLSDEMTYWGASGKVTVRGNVMLRLRSEEDSGTLLAKGEHAEYSEDTDTGRMWGELEVIRTGPDEYGQVNLYARELSFDGKREEWTASGDVHIIQYQTESRAETVRFIHPEQTMVLTGKRPRIDRRDEESMGRYEGDTITIFLNEKKMIIDGNVRGWIRLAEKKDPPPLEDVGTGPAQKALADKRDLSDKKQLGVNLPESEEIPKETE